MAEYQLRVFPTEGRWKKIEKSLEFILPIYDFQDTYVFNDDRRTVDEDFNAELSIPDVEFSFKEFSLFVEWFTLFEGLAKERNFSTTTVFTYVEYHFSSCCKIPVMSDITNKYSITNTLELGCALTKELFSAEEICRAQKRFLQALESADKDIVIYSIHQICAEMVFACFAFNHVCPISEAWIISHIRMDLPQSILAPIERIYSAMSEMNLAEFANALKVHWKKRPGFNIHLDSDTGFKRKKSDAVKEEDSDSDFDCARMKCFCCGERGHAKSLCPIKNVICENCERRGHLTNMCKYIVIRDNQNDRKGLARISKKKIVFIFDNKDTKLKSIKQHLVSLKKQLKRLIQEQETIEQRNTKTEKNKKEKNEKEEKTIEEKKQKKTIEDHLIN